MKGQREWDFKLNMEGQSVCFVYDLNLLQMHGTKCAPMSLDSIDKCLKGVEASIR